MIKKRKSEEMTEDLYRLIASIPDEKTCRALFEDMCTLKEIEQMAQRVRAARLLMENKTYNQVIEETDISSATLSRVSKCVQTGKGYSTLLKPEE